jgi:type II secretory pathway component PulF
MPGRRAIPDAVLADLFGRLSIALGAGVDLRRAWHSESARVPRSCRPAMEVVAQGLAAGDDLSTALARAAAAFPADTRGMVRVGVATGHLAEVLRDIASHLARSIASRRALRAALARPAMQIVVATVAVAVIILASGLSGDRGGEGIDFLGLGLTGPRGAAVFLGAVLSIVIVGLALVPTVMRSWRARGWARVIGERIPLLGAAARAAEASAWCRAASLGAHAGLRAGETTALAASAAPGLAIDPQALEARLRQGDDLVEALAACGRLPREVLEAVGVGEATGTTAEALDRVSERLDDAARRGFAAVVQAVGYGVWAAVAVLVAVLVIRVMSAYVAIIQKVAAPP